METSGITSKTEKYLILNEALEVLLCFLSARDSNLFCSFQQLKKFELENAALRQENEQLSAEIYGHSASLPVSQTSQNSPAPESQLSASLQRSPVRARRRSSPKPSPIPSMIFSQTANSDSQFNQFSSQPSFTSFQSHYDPPSQFAGHSQFGSSNASQISNDNSNFLSKSPLVSTQPTFLHLTNRDASGALSGANLGLPMLP